MNHVREERTGWRDQEISLRHRRWGFNCPAVDLDFVMLEYNHGKPCALVEYKHVNAQPPNPNHHTYKALVALADGYQDGPLPCFVATYDPDAWSFRVLPLNNQARQHYAHCIGQVLTEQRFVLSLHLLRKSTLTTEDKKAIEALRSSVNPPDGAPHAP